MRTVLRHTSCGGIPNARLLINQSLFGGPAADPLCSDDLKLNPGDALLMHPYLSHSSSWNYQSRLRIGGRLSFEYKRPMTAETLQEMGRRQKEAQSGLDRACIPPNTNLYLQTLENGVWQDEDWNGAPGRFRTFLSKKLRITRC